MQVVCSPVALKDQPALRISSVHEITGANQGTQSFWGLKLLIQTEQYSFREITRVGEHPHRQTLTGIACRGADYSFEFRTLQNNHTEEMLVNVTRMFIQSWWCFRAQMFEKRSGPSVLTVDSLPGVWCLVS